MRRRRWTRLAWFAGVAFIVYLTIGVIIAGRDTPVLPPTTHDIELQGGYVRVHDHLTKPSWRLDYDRAVFSSDYTSGSVDGVHNGVLFRKGKPYLRIAAEHVNVNLQTLDFTAIGKVRVERIGAKQKEWYDTDLISWTNGAKLLYMNHPSYLHTGTQILRLERVTMDFTTKTVHVGKLNGSINVRR